MSGINRCGCRSKDFKDFWLESYIGIQITNPIVLPAEMLGGIGARAAGGIAGSKIATKQRQFASEYSIKAEQIRNLKSSLDLPDNFTNEECE